MRQALALALVVALLLVPALLLAGGVAEGSAAVALLRELAVCEAEAVTEGQGVAEAEAEGRVEGVSSSRDGEGGALTVPRCWRPLQYPLLPLPEGEPETRALALPLPEALAQALALPLPPLLPVAVPEAPPLPLPPKALGVTLPARLPEARAVEDSRLVREVEGDGSLVLLGKAGVALAAALALELELREVLGSGLCVVPREAVTRAGVGELLGEALPGCREAEAVSVAPPEAVMLETELADTFLEGEPTAALAVGSSDRVLLALAVPPCRLLVGLPEAQRLGCPRVAEGALGVSEAAPGVGLSAADRVGCTEAEAEAEGGRLGVPVAQGVAVSPHPVLLLGLKDGVSAAVPVPAGCGREGVGGGLLLPQGVAAAVGVPVGQAPLDMLAQPLRLARPVRERVAAEEALGASSVEVACTEYVGCRLALVLAQVLGVGVAQGEGVAAPTGLRVAAGAEGLTPALLLAQGEALGLPLPLPEAEAQGVALRDTVAEIEAVRLLLGELVELREGRVEREAREELLIEGEGLTLAVASEALAEAVGSIVGTLVVRGVVVRLVEAPGDWLAAPTGLPLASTPLAEEPGEAEARGVGERLASEEGLGVGEPPCASEGVDSGGVPVALLKVVTVVQAVREGGALVLACELAEGHCVGTGEALLQLVADLQGEALPVPAALALKEALLLLQEEAHWVGEGERVEQGVAVGLVEAGSVGVRAPVALLLALPPLALALEYRLALAPALLLPLLLVQALALAWLLAVLQALLQALSRAVALSVPPPALPLWLLLALPERVPDTLLQAEGCVLWDGQPETVPAASVAVALVEPQLEALALPSWGLGDSLPVGLLPAHMLGLEEAQWLTMLLAEKLAEAEELREACGLLLPVGENNALCVAALLPLAGCPVALG